MDDSLFLNSDHDIDDDQEDFVRQLSLAHQPIQRCIRTWLPDKNDADDAIQETYLLLWRKFNQFTPGTDFTRWACSIAFKVARRVHERRRSSQKFMGTAFSDDLFHDIRHIQEGNFEYLELRREQLRQCLANLGPADSKVLQAYYSEGRSVSQIATQMKQSERAIYRQLERIRLALYRCVNRHLHLESGDA